MLNVIADDPLTFIYSDPTATTFSNAATMGALLNTKPNVHGFEVTPDLTITTTIQKLAADGTSLTARFTTPPSANSKVTIGSNIYRVTQTHEDNLQSVLVLDLVSSVR